jgi:RimJ/RimL family protein N-acetyltransferase
MRLETERLVLRPWEDRDLAAFAAINGDDVVRRYYYPSVLTRPQSDAVIGEVRAELAATGFGFLAVERKADGVLIGGGGLSRPEPAELAAFPLEIGWILGRAHWRQGYATEISRACFDHAWTVLGAPMVIGYTSAINTPSRRAMEKAGMAHVAGADFDDDSVPPGDPLRPHVLYRIDRPDLG